MSIRNKYETELSRLYGKLVAMCHAVEDAIVRSVTALRTRDAAMAKQVMDDDRKIDLAEREIEQDCLKILLMERPVAGDFREISAALKMITDLERIADQAADISELSLQFGEEKFIKEPEHILEMSRLAVGMVKDGVQSYINRDLETARGLDKRDDRIDELFVTVNRDLVALIRENPDNAEQAILFMMIAKYLERIGDHAVNIGEWAEYVQTGYHRIG